MCLNKTEQLSRLEIPSYGTSNIPHNSAYCVDSCSIPYSGSMLRDIEKLVQGDTAIVWQSQIHTSTLLLLAVTNFTWKQLRGTAGSTPSRASSEKHGLDAALKPVALGACTT